MARQKLPRITKTQLRDLPRADLRPAQFDSLQRSERAGHPRLQQIDEAASELVASSLEAAGLDFSKLESLGERYDKAVLRVLETQKKDAIKRTPKVARTLYSGLDARVSGVRDLSDGNALVLPARALRTPFMIWAGKHSSKVLVDSQIVDARSWAKVRYIPALTPSSSKPDTEPRRLSFWFMWQNPGDYYAVVRASTYLVLSGHIQGYALGGRRIQISPKTKDREAQYRYELPGYAYGGVAPSFTAWQWWNQPTPDEVPMNYQYGIELEVRGAPVGQSPYGPNYGYPRTESNLVSRSYEFQSEMNLVTVPPLATLVFEVAVELVSRSFRGNVDLDFASGDFRITCPFVLIDVLTGPPV